MTDDMHEYRAPFVEDYPGRTISPEATTGDISTTFSEVRRDLHALMDAAAKATEADGWSQAPGNDPRLPAEVAAAAGRLAADADRTPADYWVKYRPATPLGDIQRHGFEMVIAPASITRTPDAIEVTLDPAAYAQTPPPHLPVLVPVTPTVPLPTIDTEAFAIGIEHLQERMAEFGRVIGPKLAEAADALRAAWAPVSDALRRSFGPLIYLTDGDAPGPITDATSALAALAYAESTTVLQHPPKPNRRNAKRAYLAVKRHLPPEARERFRALPMRQFGAL